MDYPEFKQLIKKGEKESVDFKIKCSAFLPGGSAAKAELAKDICAMANNGNITSYILIGVSDTGRSFQSVSNPKLTDDNLQSFCRDAIFPTPKIKVYRKHWAGKVFIIIQVGPHVRRAYRLNRNYIDYPHQKCYRRNEVWIRRGATSDLASPEEVARLVKGQPPEEKRKPEGNVQYAKLARQEQLQTILKDFQKCVEEIGGCLCGNRVVIPLRSLRYVWRCIVLRECTQRFGLWSCVARGWEYEHGVLLLVMGTVSKRAFHTYEKVNFKEKWGWFSYYDLPNFLEPEPFVLLPVNTKKASLVVLTLPNLADTDALRNSFHSLLQFLNADSESYRRIHLAREGINDNLRRWLRQGWLIETNRMYSRRWRPEKSELGENEIFDRRYGNFILRREKSKKLMSMAQTVLDLSAGRLP